MTYKLTVYICVVLTYKCKTNATHANGLFVGHFFLGAPIGIYIPLETLKEMVYK